MTVLVVALLLAGQHDLAQMATAAWDVARAAAAHGGSPDSLLPVRRDLEALEALGRKSPSLEIEYATSLVRAAMAASQDERAEMALYLEHAASIGERFQVLKRDPAAALSVPLPIDEAAGELWLEVDRYEEAVEAYRRAVTRAPAPRACSGYRQALEKLDAPERTQEARALLARCP